LNLGIYLSFIRVDQQQDLKDAPINR